MTAFAPPSTREGVAANTLKKYLGVLQWDTVEKILDARQVWSDSRAANRAHHEFVAQMRGSEPPKWEEYDAQQSAEDDEMGVHIGDIYQNIEVPGSKPSAVVAGKAGVSMAAEAVKPASSTWKKWAAVACLGAAGFLAPSAYAELSALMSGAAEIKVLWDGQEIPPGGSVSGEAEQDKEAT